MFRTISFLLYKNSSYSNTNVNGSKQKTFFIFEKSSIYHKISRINVLKCKFIISLKNCHKNWIEVKENCFCRRKAPTIHLKSLIMQHFNNDPLKRKKKLSQHFVFLLKYLVQTSKRL